MKMELLDVARKQEYMIWVRVRPIGLCWTWLRVIIDDNFLRIPGLTMGDYGTLTMVLLVSSSPFSLRSR